MIYLENTTDPIRVLVPKPSSRSSRSVLLTIKNEVTGEVVYRDDVEDIGTYRAFFVFRISLPKRVAIGEYEYSLKYLGEVVGRGLAQFGRYSKADEYDEKIEIKQYGGE